MCFHSLFFWKFLFDGFFHSLFFWELFFDDFFHNLFFWKFLFDDFFHSLFFWEFLLDGFFHINLNRLFHEFFGLVFRLWFYFLRRFFWNWNSLLCCRSQDGILKIKGQLVLNRKIFHFCSFIHVHLRNIQFRNLWYNLSFLNWFLYILRLFCRLLLDDFRLWLFYRLLLDDFRLWLFYRLLLDDFRLWLFYRLFLDDFCLWLCHRLFFHHFRFQLWYFFDFLRLCHRFYDRFFSDNFRFKGRNVIRKHPFRDYIRIINFSCCIHHFQFFFRFINIFFCRFEVSLKDITNTSCNFLLKIPLIANRSLFLI